MKRSNVTITDLTEMLRIQGCPSIADVAYAYLETNGSFSVILKPEKKPVTREDLSLTPEQEAMPCIIISDGKIYRRNLERSGLTEKILNREMRKHKIESQKDIFLCFCDEKKMLYFYTKKTSLFCRLRFPFLSRKEVMHEIAVYSFNLPASRLCLLDHLIFLYRPYGEYAHSRPGRNPRFCRGRRLGECLGFS